MPDGTKRAKAFVSYSSRDKNFVVKVLDQLPDNVEYIMDEITFETGHATIDEICKGIEEADYCLLFISTNSMSSPWVEEEMKIAHLKMMNNHLQSFILPIVIESMNYKDLPKIIQVRVAADLSKDYNGGLDKIRRIIAQEDVQEFKEKVIEKVEEAKSKYSLIPDSAVSYAKYLINQTTVSGLYNSIQNVSVFLSGSTAHAVSEDQFFNSFMGTIPDPLRAYFKKTTVKCRKCGFSINSHDQLCRNCGMPNYEQ